MTDDQLKELFEAKQIIMDLLLQFSKETNKTTGEICYHHKFLSSISSAFEFMGLVSNASGCPDKEQFNEVYSKYHGL